ncbi:VanZ family protein [Flavobacterium arsenatis]|uniref:VanZ family protein n=1 Tax=Flavobacterium arsenatis TaxID=1484332 RepID=A0ABU1TKM3_9FLAO|nr:VanZ family protein [Flavobacterium arsenatis]
MKLIKNLSEHKKITLWLAIIWTAIVTYFCLASFNELPQISVDNFDKLGHITFHFGITFLWFLAFRFKFLNENKKALIKAFLFSFFYGITIEICQDQFTATRTGDVMDVVANISGSFLAIIFIILCIKYSRNTAEN